MPLEMFEKIISDYIESTDNPQKPLVVVWHGGEPLIAGVDYFQNVLEMQRRLGKNRKFINVVQTNATLVNKVWAKFIKENNIVVGVSIDGPKKFNDIHRKNRVGNSTFEMSERGLENLKEAGNSFSVICVVSNENYDKAKLFLDFFASIGVLTVSFIPCFDYNLKHTLDNKKYEIFMKTAFDYWMSKYKGSIKIRFLEDIMRKIVCLAKNQKCYTGCELSDMCGRNIAVLDNGDIYACACLTPVKHMKLGNVKTLSLKEIPKTTSFKKMVEQYNDINKKCLTCDVKSICSTGCLNRRLSCYSSEKIDYFCEARRKIINHVKNSLPKYFPIKEPVNKV
jgi:uncharacterized protein